MQKKYSKEFKREAVRLMVVDGLSGVEGEQSKDFDVSEICGALEVHRSSYYGWRNRGLSSSKKFELELKAENAEIEKSAKGPYSCD